jgi:hypothetical protein
MIKFSLQNNWCDKCFSLGAHIVFVDGYYALHIFLFNIDITMGWVKENE